METANKEFLEEFMLIYNNRKELQDFRKKLEEIPNIDKINVVLN